MAFSEETKMALADLETQARAIKEADNSKGRKADPLASANLQRVVDWLYDTHFVHNEEPTLRRWKDNWWRWRKGIWLLVRPSDLDGEIFRRVITSKEDGGFGLENFPHFARLDALALLRDHLVALPDSQEFQSWLPAQSEKGADIDTSGTWINCSKGILRTADTQTPAFISHTPRYFTPVLIPRSPAREPPMRWSAFLDEVLERDQGRIAVLQEWFGYCLLPTTRFHKMLMLVGPGSNGKSVVLHVLREMLGTYNCSSVDLDDMNTRFGPFGTFGKVANICGDIATRYLKKPGRVKAFIGGDECAFEQKYMTAFSALPTAKLIFSMNDLPGTDDESDGFMRRMHPIPFTFTPSMVDPVYANPKSPEWPFRDELDGIFTWALEGLVRLLSNEGQFTASTIIDTCMSAWRFSNEGIRRYAEERLDFDPAATFSTPCDWISLDYEKWATKNREHKFTAQSLDKRLRRIFPGLEVLRKKTGTKAVRHWHGLRFHPEAPLLGD